MRKCVDCGADCRNTCANGKHGYCANCRDASGSMTCGKCRAAAKSAKQLAQSKQRTARQAQAAANSAAAMTTAGYIPPPSLAAFAQVAPGAVGQVPPTVHPVVTRAHLAAQRSPIYLMDEATFKRWQEKALEGLEDTLARGSAYLARRATRGTRTSTDIAMERDQVLFEDLIQALKELDILREWAEDTQTQQSQQTGSDTGMLLSYDGKLQP